MVLAHSFSYFWTSSFKVGKFFNLSKEECDVFRKWTNFQKNQKILPAWTVKKFDSFFKYFISEL